MVHYHYHFKKERQPSGWCLFWLSYLLRTWQQRCARAQSSSACIALVQGVARHVTSMQLLLLLSPQSNELIQEKERQGNGAIVTAGVSQPFPPPLTTPTALQWMTWQQQLPTRCLKASWIRNWSILLSQAAAPYTMSGEQQYMREKQLHQTILQASDSAGTSQQSCHSDTSVLRPRKKI